MVRAAESLMPVRLLVVGTLFFTLGSSWACSHRPFGPSAVAPGVWGGDHIIMTVADTATHVEFDCANGDIAGAFTVDTDGQFTAVGTFVREHGGPIRVDETPDSHSASYAGSVSANTMTLTVRLSDSSEAIGTFALTRGTPGRVVKCL